MGSLATIRGLHKTYVMGDETVHALDGVDLDFDRGEYIAILGPSGSGKSTLMHILGFMDTPTKGSILFEGEEVSDALGIAPTASASSSSPSTSCRA